MKKFIFSTVLALAAFSEAFAENVSLAQASDIASKFFQQALKRKVKVTPVDITTKTHVKNIKGVVATQSSAPAYYIFNEVQGNGFVMVSGEDKMPALLGYSLEGCWPVDEEIVPPSLKDALQDYETLVEAVREGRASLPARSNKITNDATIIVAPLLTTKWDQTYPYNKYAPAIPDGYFKKKYNNHIPVGCGAIALGQVINYWKTQGKPVEHPVAHQTYYTYIDYYKENKTEDTVRVSLSPETIYNTTLIPDSILYTADTTTWMTPEEWEVKGDEVGRFLRDVAWALNMSWTSNGGGCDDTSIQLAALMGFDFSTDAITLFTEGSGGLADPAVFKRMKESLDKKMPIVVGGQDVSHSGGHAFVFDGYDSNNFVHVNWGWGGACNNWFDPAVLQSYMYDAKPKGNYNFALDNRATLFLHPREAVEIPKLNSEQLYAYEAKFSGCSQDMEDELIQDYDNNPVYYIDKQYGGFRKNFQNMSYQKNLGFDYDYMFIVSKDDSELSTETVSVKFKDVDCTTAKAYIPAYQNIDTENLKDGMYYIKGKMREVLNANNGEWLTATHNDSALVKGKDIIANPATYNKYWHAKECAHICDKSNQLLVHIDYLQDPDNLTVADSLQVQLNVNGYGNNTIQYLDASADTTAVLSVTYKGEDTVLANYNDVDVNGFIDALKKETHGDEYFVGVTTKTIKFKEPGIYTVSYTWPAMQVCISQEIVVNCATGIQNVDQTCHTEGVPTTRTYNLAGQSVGRGYHGLVIQNGKKLITK